MVEFSKRQIPEEVRISFINRVKKLPWVVGVYDTVDSEDDGPCLLTVISAPPFDSFFRNLVYNAEAEVLRGTDFPMAFRLINTRELKEGSDITSGERIYPA